jgi:hypothetical protein
MNGNTRAINLPGLEFGVFYNNQFQDNYITIGFHNSEMNGWNYPLTQGGANYPFFENNNFTQIIARGGFIGEGGRGGRIVFRHNNIIGYGGNGGEVWDSHGVNGVYPTDTGTVSAEYYDNNIGLSVNTRVFFHRGGKAIVFNNTISGNTGNMEITEYQGWSYCTAAGYPKPQQVNKSFYWNNKVNGNPLAPTIYCTSGSCTSCVPPQYDSSYIQLNRDYWLPTSGLDTSKPGSCTEGDYYAATDTERLYLCQSNTWTLYYQPYTYPHPLTLT